MLAVYISILVVHSLLRWAAILFGIIAVTRAFRGTVSRAAWQRTDDRSGIFFVASLDLQLLLGLLLYFFLSPLTTAAFGDMGAAMRSPVLRFWAVEHSALMIAAVVLAHIGRARSRRAVEAVAKHRRAVLFFGLALAAILVATPWPFMAHGRPLLRWW
jgi:hypothetical protein